MFCWQRRDVQLKRQSFHRAALRLVASTDRCGAARANPSDRPRLGWPEGYLAWPLGRVWRSGAAPGRKKTMTAMGRSASIGFITSHG